MLFDGGSAFAQPDGLDAYYHYLELARSAAASSEEDPATIGRHLFALAICLERADDRPDPQLQDTRARVAFQLRILAHEAKRISGENHRSDFCRRVLEVIGSITEAKEGAYFVGMAMFREERRSSSRFSAP